MEQVVANAMTEAAWAANVVIEEGAAAEGAEIEAEVVVEATATIEVVVPLGVLQRDQDVKMSSSNEGRRSHHSKRFDLTLEHNFLLLDHHPDKMLVRHHAPTRSATRSATVASENASAGNKNVSSANAHPSLRLLRMRPLMPATLRRAIVDGIQLQLQLLLLPLNRPPTLNLPLQPRLKRQRITTSTPESTPSKLQPQLPLHRSPRPTKLSNGLNGSRWRRTSSKHNRLKVNKLKQLPLPLLLSPLNPLSHRLTHSMFSSSSSSSNSRNSRRHSMDTRILSTSPRRRRRIRRPLRIQDCSITMRSNNSSSPLKLRRAFRIF